VAYGLKQAGAGWLELLDILQSKNMYLFQITTKGLTPFRADSVGEGANWYISFVRVAQLVFESRMRLSVAGI